MKIVSSVKTGCNSGQDMYVVQSRFVSVSLHQNVHEVQQSKYPKP